MQRLLWALGILLGLSLLGGILFRACCVDEIDSYELGYRYDLRSGQISRVSHPGYVVHAPWPFVEVHTIDLRPMQVCINANARVLNCKLVQFDPAGLDLFLAWHGRADYKGGGEESSLNKILMSYAYEGSGRNYPFLKIIRELKADEKVVAP